MIRIELERVDTGKIIPIDLPVNAAELKLSQALDWQFGFYALHDWFTEHEDTWFKYRYKYIVMTAKVVAEIYSEVESFRDLLGIKSDSFVNMGVEDMHEHISAMCKGSFKHHNILELEESITKIMDYTSSIVLNAKHDVNYLVVNYKGNEYKLPSYIEDKALNKNVHAPSSIQQAVETMAVKTNYNNTLSEMLKVDPKADRKNITKNVLFTKYVSEVAILLNNPEDLPDDDADFKIWLSQQIDFFKDIDYQTVLNIGEWFDTYIDELEADKENKYFFNSLLEPQSKEEFDAWKKSKKAGESFFKAIGWKFMYPRLFKINPWQKSGESIKHSVLKASMTDGVRLISSDNVNQGT
jgi:hypothetical protein